MKHGRLIIAALVGAMLITSLAGCGSKGTNDGESGEYQKINLSMAVNGTDTQIDSLVAHHFADLVSERSGGNIVIDVFSNDTLAGGNSTKGVEYIAVGGSDLGAYATCVLANLEPKLSVALQLGIDPIHLGTVMIVNLAIGLFTPPVGVNLYVACGIGDIKIEEITKGIIPCLLAELVVLLLITYIPSLSLMFVG